MDREPCFWTTTQPGFNTPHRERQVMVDGRRVREKFPQRGHQGDYDDLRPARGIRSVLMIRHDGHTVQVALTNAAAHLDHTTPWGQYQLMKARSLGWFQPSQCPCALLLTGELTREHIVQVEILNSRPCDPGTYSVKAPCPHVLAERAARTAQHNRDEAERLASFRDQGEKIIDAQRAQTAELVGAITAALGNAKVDTTELYAAIADAVNTAVSGKTPDMEDLKATVAAAVASALERSERPDRPDRRGR